MDFSVDAAQRGASEGRQAMQKNIAQSGTLVDAANLYIAPIARREMRETLDIVFDHGMGVLS